MDGGEGWRALLFITPFNEFGVDGFSGCFGMDGFSGCIGSWRSCLCVVPCEVWAKSLVVSAVVRLSLCSSLRGMRLLVKGELWGVGLWLCCQCKFLNICNFYQRKKFF